MHPDVQYAIVMQLDLFDALTPAVAIVAAVKATKRRGRRWPTTAKAQADRTWGAAFQLLPDEWREAERLHGHKLGKNHRAQESEGKARVGWTGDG
jgi:hypothetical protein